ncbi:MAG: RDD family protein [Chloroflexota bacterium]|nr:RDD family protein [Chloroflexota bacterium]
MPTAATTDRAGWWTRVLAILIDWIGLGIVSAVLASLTGGDATGTGANGLSTLLGLAYFCYFWSSYGKGQTLGMRVLNIRVVKTDGSQLDLIGAFIRYIGLFVSIICLFIGVIWAAFDGQKQGWHDKIAGTYVVKA